MGTGVIKLTQKQSPDGGFLGMLAASLGIPLITSLLSGKGLQVDAQRVSYIRILRGPPSVPLGTEKRKKNQDKPLSNIEIEM